MKVTEEMIDVAAAELRPSLRADIRRALEAALAVSPEVVIIEEPTEVGTKLIDRDDDVWVLHPEGWACITQRMGPGTEWANMVRWYSPLRRLP